jgi:hypothetical protein
VSYLVYDYQNFMYYLENTGRELTSDELNFQDFYDHALSKGTMQDTFLDAAHKMNLFLDFEYHGNQCLTKDRTEFHGKFSAYGKKGLQIVQHSKIPVNAITKYVVSLCDTNKNHIGFGYCITSRAILCPAHYKGVTYAKKVISNTSTSYIPLIPEGTETSFTIGNIKDGLALYSSASDLPHAKIQLGIATSGYGLIASNTFIQVSGFELLSVDKGHVLSYVGESQPGDCGQVVVDAETGYIIGIHDGIDKNNQIAKKAFGIAFTASNLAWIDETLSKRGLGNL